MGIREDYQNAVKLAKAGKYHEARSLLIGYDHPKTDRLLKKINEAIAADSSPSEAENPKTEEKSNNGAIGCLTLFIAIFVCSLWIALTPGENSSLDNNLSQQNIENQDGTTPDWLNLAVLVAESESDVNVLSAKVVDGRANGGERMVITAFTTNNEFAGMGAIIGAVSSGARELSGDIDSIVMILGPDANTTSMIATTDYNDAIAFLDGRIDAETLYSRMTIDRQ